MPYTSKQGAMHIYDLTEFFSLSRSINYHLNATTSGRYYVLRYIAGDKKLSSREKSTIMKALTFLIKSYGNRRRRLGPPAVLHPIRAAALLVRAMDTMDVKQVLTELFHDIFEDIFPFDFSSPEWQAIMRQEFKNIMDSFDHSAGDAVFDSLLHLARREDELYYGYLGRMLREGGPSNMLLQVKMADRLDNTLDMRLDLHEPREDRDFFLEIFKLGFLNFPFKPPEEQDHPPPAPMNGAYRLYDLSKNAVLLSMIRQFGGASPDPCFEVLFHALSVASLKEAQRIFVHLTCFHKNRIKNAREILMDTMEYCYSGGITAITVPGKGHSLDGMMATYFDHPNKNARDHKLAELYENKGLMLQTSMAFAVIFYSFLNDQSFFIRGIGPEGIHPE